MGLKNIEGFVINSLDYEDYAQIITIFSKSLGKLLVYAPGIRKNISKNKYSVQLFCKSEFEIFLTNNLEKMSRLKTGLIINSFSNISKDYNSYLYVQTICEVVDKLSENRLPDIETYNLLDLFLKNIDKEVKKFASYIFALFYLTKVSGNKMILDRCVRCRKSSMIYRRFEYKENGLVCSNCIFRNENSQSPTFIDIFVDLNKFDYLEIMNNNYKFIDLIAFHIYLTNFYENEIGLFLNSMNEIKKTAAFVIPELNKIDYI